MHVPILRDIAAVTCPKRVLDTHIRFDARHAKRVLGVSGT